MESKRLKETKQCWSKKIFGAKALIIYKLCAFQNRPRMLHLANSRMCHSCLILYFILHLLKSQPNLSKKCNLIYTQLSQWNLINVAYYEIHFFLHAEMYDDEITYIIHSYLLKGGKTMQS